MKLLPFAVCAALALIGLAVPVMGEDKKASAKTPPPAVIVWSTEATIKDGMALLRASQVDLALKYAACVVPLGTRAVMMSGGYAAFPVTIVEGKFRGCRGYVMREMLEYLVIDR